MNILQRWTQWARVDGEPITTLAQVEELCAEALREGAAVLTFTSRRPRQDCDNVYFLSPRRLIEFRLPLVEIVGDNRSGFLFVLDPAGFALVQPRHVRFLRGWRYLADPPPDLPEPSAGPAENELPEHVRRELKELGL